MRLIRSFVTLRQRMDHFFWAPIVISLEFALARVLVALKDEQPIFVLMATIAFLAVGAYLPALIFSGTSLWSRIDDEIARYFPRWDDRLAFLWIGALPLTFVVAGREILRDTVRVTSMPYSIYWRTMTFCFPRKRRELEETHADAFNVWHSNVEARPFFARLQMCRYLYFGIVVAAPNAVRVVKGAMAVEFLKNVSFWAPLLSWR